MRKYIQCPRTREFTIITDHICSSSDIPEGEEELEDPEENVHAFSWSRCVDIFFHKSREKY